MTKQYAREYDIIGPPKYKKFLKQARKLYMKYAIYLKSLMPLLKDDTIKSLTFFRLQGRCKTTPYELQVIVGKLISETYF